MTYPSNYFCQLTCLIDKDSKRLTGENAAFCHPLSSYSERCTQWIQWMIPNQFTYLNDVRARYKMSTDRVPMGKNATVCAADSDLTFLSDDNVLFKVHRKNIEIFSEGLAAAAKVPKDVEFVQLVEPAAILELLFQYLYPQRHPNLKSVEFEVLNGLAEAVEKYKVYPALESCKTSMQYINSCHQIKRTWCADYNIQGRDTTSRCRGVRICSEARICGFDSTSGARSFVRSPSSTLSMCPEGRTGWVNGPCCWGNTRLFFTKCLPEPFSGDVHNLGMKSPKYQWEIYLICFNQSQYYDQWLQALQEVQKVAPSGIHSSWEHEGPRLRAVCDVYRNLADGPKSLRNLDATFMGSSDTLAWKKRAGEIVAKLKLFSEFSRAAGIGVSWTTRMSIFLVGISYIRWFRIV